MSDVPHFPHISLHRLWAFTKVQGDLAAQDFAHIIDCSKCRTALLVCLKAENFGAVLKELKKGTDEALAKAS